MQESGAEASKFTGAMPVKNCEVSPLALLQEQRSHVLLVLSNPKADREADFLEWHRNAFGHALLRAAGVLSTRTYEKSGVDITRGRWPSPPFRYLTVIEISADGAETVAGLIDHISELHQREPSAETPATWLYYPVSERVGRTPLVLAPSLIVAFANGNSGQEAEFREWYSTRHIRHALNISVIDNGQCFERTRFQIPGAMEAEFQTVAMYETAGTPEEFLASVDKLPKGALAFPMLDLSRFGEALYGSLPVSSG